MLKKNAGGSKASNLNTFAWKCINNCLPTLDHLVVRHQDLYQNKLCVFCDSHPETLHHLFTCDHLADDWQKVEWITSTQLVTTLQMDFNNLDQLTRGICNAIFDPIEPYHSTRRAHALLLRGITPEFILDRIAAITNTKSSTKPLKAVLPTLWKAFWEVIWKPRCDKLVAWETVNNITSQKKRTTSPASSSTSRSTTTATSLPNSQGVSAHRKAHIKLDTAMARCKETMDRVIKQGSLGLQHGWAYLSGKK